MNNLFVEEHNAGYEATILPGFSLYSHFLAIVLQDGCHIIFWIKGASAWVHILVELTVC